MNATATAGSLESNDALISITAQSDAKNTIIIDSIVKNQFGEAILAQVQLVLQELQVTGVQVEVKDRGALDCTLRARVETAIARFRGHNHE